MGAADRQFYSRVGLVAGTVLIGFGWLFWQAGTGAILVATGFASLVVAIALDHSARALRWLVLSLALATSPLWLTLLYLA